MPADEPVVSVIVPTYREAENLPLLVPRVAEALRSADLAAEIIIVDDNSNDGSVEAVAALQAQGHPVRILVRTEDRGLSPAVIHGFRHAAGRYLVCMDADLSHPPQKLPELIAALRDGADFVIGSRYVAGGSTDEQWGLLRWLNSRVATLLARPLTAAKDPMAGYFALPRERFAQADALSPVGYKIGLELLLKTRCGQAHEVPIHFTDRALGQSKLNLREQLKYLAHLAKLYEYRYPMLGRFARFSLVGVSGMLPDLAVYNLLLGGGAHRAVARAIAILGGMTWNFVLNRRFTFSDARVEAWPVQYLKFCGGCSLGALANLAVSTLIGGWDADNRVWLNVAALAGIGVGWLINFTLSYLVAFRRAPKK